MNDLDDADLTAALRSFVRDNTPDQAPPALAELSQERVTGRGSYTRWLVAAAIVVLVSAAAAGAWWSQRDASSPGGQLVVLGQEGGSTDHLPSTTATDWVTYADHVLEVSVTGEREVAVSDEDRERGEGLIGREVTMSVDRVLWTRPDPDRPAPGTVSWESWGWQFEGDETDRWPVVGAGTSRLEPGHTYVVAIAWEEARCAEGDEPVPARWTPLGGSAIVPADGGTIGAGEFEGREQAAAEAASGSTDDPNRTLRQELAGQDVTALTRLLDTTRAMDPETFTPPAPCP